MKCGPFVREDMLDLQVLDHQQQDWEQVMDVLPQDLPHSATVWHDGTRVACMGLIQYDRGWAAWIFLDRASHDHPLALTRSIRSRIAQAYADGCQPIVAHSDGEQASRWLRLLGFRSDGTMEFGWNRFIWENAT